MERFDLREARRNRGKSLAQAAPEIGVSETTLFRAERGTVPRPSNALRIALYYGKLPAEIWPVEREAA